MIITKVEPSSKTKFKVYIEDQFAFVLYKGELSRYGISEGMKIDPSIIEKINKEVILKRAKLRAMHLLEDMDRTEEGLREKLRQNLYPADVIEGAIDYVKSFGYIDDERYAENFVRSKMNVKSKKEIRMLLLNKGVSIDLIDRAMEICYAENSEEEAVKTILRKKRFDPASMDERQMQKMYNYLARKGFRYDVIRQVIQNSIDRA